MSTLNHHQRLFLHFYIGDAKGDETLAARMAGYTRPEQMGRRLLKCKGVSAEIVKKLEEAAAITPTEILARYSTIASLDVMEFVEFKPDVDRDGNIKLDADGEPIEKPVLNLKRVKKLRKGNLIKELKIHPSGAIEVKFHDAVEAMEKLAKYHGMYKPEQIDVHVSGSIGTDRVIAILGGYAQLAGAVGPGTPHSEPEPGGLCDRGEQCEVDAGPAFEIDQPTLALGGPEGD